MFLSKRLATIQEMCPKGVVADIGADHGKLIISLVKNNIASHGFAVENKKGPYERLVAAIEESGFKDKITPIFGDGIEKIPDSVDTLVLAGMGGLNIVSILSKHRNKLGKIETIIVDAHNAIPQMREAISKLGFSIADEKIVFEDDIYYEIIKFIKSDHAFYSDIDLEFGPILRTQKSSMFKAKYINRINEIDNLITSKTLPESRIKELLHEKDKIGKILWIQENF